jgi:hypothetical protein
MGCDYVVVYSLVIEYIDIENKFCKVSTNYKIKNCYLDENIEYCENNHYDEIRSDFLNKKIQENTRKKILFENEKWVKNSYKKRYKNFWYCNYIKFNKMIKVYKEIKAIDKSLYF